MNVYESETETHSRVFLCVDTHVSRGMTEVRSATHNSPRNPSYRSIL